MSDDDDADRLLARATSLATLVGLDPRVTRLAGSTRATGTSGSDGAEHPFVVVLITDIVGSTAVSQQLGDVAYFELVMAHHELVRSCLPRWGGHEFSESGDGLLAWFADVEPAVRAAAEILRRAAATGPQGMSVRMRAGIAGGATLVRAGRPYGLVLNRASRLVDLARPDEVVLDRAVAAAVPAEYGIAASYETELRGIGREAVSVLRL